MRRSVARLGALGLAAAATLLGQACAYDWDVPTPASPTPCGPGKPCEPARFCKYADGHCGREGPGLCIPRSECPPPGPPACGCDGKIYSSICLAHQAGVDETNDKGVCPAPPGPGP